MKIFFIGICGISMSALACLLKEEGHEIKGSDLNCKNKRGTTVKNAKIAIQSVYFSMCVQTKVEKIRFHLYLYRYLYSHK